MLEEDKIIMNKPDTNLIDEDKTVTISLFTYNHLMYESFKLQNAKALYDVTQEKLDKLYNYVMYSPDMYLSSTDREQIKNIYYDIKEPVQDN